MRLPVANHIWLVGARPLAGLRKPSEMQIGLARERETNQCSIGQPWVIRAAAPTPTSPVHQVDANKVVRAAGVRLWQENARGFACTHVPRGFCAFRCYHHSSMLWRRGTPVLTSRISHDSDPGILHQSWVSLVPKWDWEAVLSVLVIIGALQIA